MDIRNDTLYFYTYFNEVHFKMYNGKDQEKKRKLNNKGYIICKR